MDIFKLYDRLTDYIPKSLILTEEPMKLHTSFGIGGPVDIMLLPSEAEHICIALSVCKDLAIPVFIMGNGSNLLVKDRGVRGLVIKISDYFRGVRVEDNHIRARAGTLLAAVASAALEAGMVGLEFAAGIPGTLGGAVAMNAGAYTGEMKDSIQSVWAMDKSGNQLHLTSEQLRFGYRSSYIQEQELIVLEAVMKLNYGDRLASASMTAEYSKLRKEKQPLLYPSAGSTFKRPPGHYAGKLIEGAGFKGLRIGGAQVSELHCGFIINVGNATAQDVIALIEIVREGVREKDGIDMLLEIKIIGE